ncbi:MAG: GNAT family N-acetyltransferase [Candidatus Acidiferrum sp.]
MRPVPNAHFKSPIIVIVDANSLLIDPMATLDPLDNLVWRALDTTHSHFRVGTNLARRYPADIAPFAALADSSRKAFTQLESLLAPNDVVHLIGEKPDAPASLEVGLPLDTYQMFAPPHPPPTTHPNVVALHSKHATEMFDLITLAFPGFYKSQTYKMGNYFGIRQDGKLIAMAGERLCIPGCHEISAVCTHPGHTGKGHARALMLHSMQLHATAGLKSFLHVGQKNTRAVNLYKYMGFQITNAVTLWPIQLRSK